MMVRRLAAIVIAFLVAVLPIALGFGTIQFVDTWQVSRKPPGEWFVDIMGDTFRIFMITYFFAIVFSAVPFVLLRSLAGWWGKLNYQTAMLFGAINGVLAFIVFVLFSGGGLNIMAALHYAGYALMGVGKGALYWWTEKKLARIFSASKPPEVFA